MWAWIYNPQVGLLNDLLLRLGLLQTAVPWLADPATSLYAIIAALVWQGFPFFAIMILAGLQTIPASLYEAAEIDGAGGWHQFWHITLPGLRGVLVTAVMLRIIWVANSVDVIYVMTGGGPGYATHTLPLYAFKRTYSSMDFGYGSALAVAFSLLLLSAIVLYLRRVGRGSNEWPRSNAERAATASSEPARFACRAGCCISRWRRSCSSRWDRTCGWR
jgi:multiple sugar transport system permease protein